MSKIQEALRKLQKGTPPSPGNGRPMQPPGMPLPETVVPIASKKKVEIDGEKYPLVEERLIRGGLLAPLEEAIPIADQFRRIKRPIIELIANSSAGERMNVVMVASALPGAGKTFCSMNLAASISLERELNVLLVDADVAKPHISRATGLDQRPGLIDLLVDDSVNIEDVLVRTTLNDIQILPAGRKHSQSTELLASDRMAELTVELATRYPDRVIILDSPPLLMTSEAQALAKQVGQIVLVVECGETTHQHVDDTLELLDREKPINVILNKNVYAQPGGYYGGGYGFDGFNEEQ